MSTTVVAPGPGAMQTEVDRTIGWDAADVSMRYEDVAPQHGTDTVAVLELNADNLTHTEKASIQIELTLGDVEALKAKLALTLVKADF